MVAAQVTPAPLLRRHGSAPPWLSSSSPFFLHRRASSPFLLHRRASPPSAISGCRRQDYSHSSDMAVRGSSAFKLRFYPNLEVQNIAQEWVKESRRLFYLRTANNVTNNIYKGSTPLWTGIVQNELSEDRRGLNYTYLNNMRERVSFKSIVNRHGNNRELVGHSMINQHVKSVPAPISVVNNSVKCFSMPRASKVEIPWRDYSPTEDPLLDKSNTEVILELDDKVHDGADKKEKKLVVRKVVSLFPTKAAFSEESLKARKALASIYDEVLVVDDIESARSIVKLLTTKYKSFIHACDTKVANIDAKEETPVGHGEVICFSICSANSDVQAADFGNGKTCIWVDVLDGGRGVLMEFAPFFEDPSIKKGDHISCAEGRIHCSLNINTETGRLSARTPNLQNQPALEKDRYRIRQAFVATPGNSLIVADYGQLELRILAHLTNCKSMLDAFKAGGDFHSRTAMNMYQHIRDAVQEKKVLLEWHPQPGQEKPPVPLLKDAFGTERRKAKMLNFSIAYGKTAVGLSRDWKVSVKEARDTLKLWYGDRKEVLAWQKSQKKLAREKGEVYTLLGRSRHFPHLTQFGPGQRGHIERAAINAPVQGSAADVAMCAMLEIERNVRLKDLGWRLLLQVHDEVILEGPSESAEVAKAIVVECMSKPFYGTNILNVDLAVDAKCAKSWYAAK